MDVIYRVDIDLAKVGKTFILLSSYLGSHRCKVQNYQYVMAICRVIGYHNLCITVTCNPKWQKIKYLLKEMDDTDNESRIQAIYKVFKIKLHKLINNLKHRNYFGKIIVNKCTTYILC